MSPRTVEALCRELAALERAIGELKRGSGRQPLVFPQAVLSLQKRVRAIEVSLRQAASANAIPKIVELSEADRVFRK